MGRLSSSSQMLNCCPLTDSCNKKNDICRTMFLVTVITTMVILQFLQHLTTSDKCSGELSYNMFSLLERAGATMMRPFMKSFGTRLRASMAGESSTSFIISLAIFLESIWLAIFTISLSYQVFLLVTTVMALMYIVVTVDFASLFSSLGKQNQTQLMNLQASCVPHVNNVFAMLRGFLVAATNQIVVIFMAILDSDLLKQLDSMTLFSEISDENAL